MRIKSKPGQRAIVGGNEENAKKTDRELQRDVVAEPGWDSSVDATWIDVEARAGVVTLAGLVNSRAERCRAQTATWRMNGVRGGAKNISVMVNDGTLTGNRRCAPGVRNMVDETTIAA